MLLKLSRKSQKLTKEAFLGALAKGAVKGVVGAGKLGVKGTVGALKTKPGRAVIIGGGLVAGMGAEGFRRGTGAMHGRNPRGNPFK